MRERGGRTMAKVIESTDLSTIQNEIHGAVEAGAQLYTDEHGAYSDLDGLFFRATGKLNAKGVPGTALIYQGVWIVVLILMRTREVDAAGTVSYGNLYSDLLNYVVFAALMFYILTIVGLFVLRRTRPDAERPYRAIGYPVLPAIYIVMALFIDVVLLRYKPQYTWPGLIVVLIGIPVYYAWSRSSRRVGTGASA